MARTEREVVARLGKVGLTRALNDILDQARVIRLANAVGLAYPGMRTRSQKRSRLIADLVEKAGRDDAACLAVVRSLRKETAAVSKEWATISPDKRPERLTDPEVEEANGRLGAYLFVAASAAPEPLVEDALNGLLLRVNAPEPARAEAPHVSSKESPAKEAQRLRKKCAELQKKVRYLEGQIAKTKDVEKANKRDLLQRKGELAEARMLAERLRRELDENRGAAGDSRAPEKPPPTSGFDELDRSVKRLATEQRRLAHRIEKLAETPSPPAAAPSESMAP